MSLPSLTPSFLEAVLNETKVRLQELHYLLTTISVTVLTKLTPKRLHIRSSLSSPLFTRTTLIWSHTHQYGQMDSFSSRSPSNGPTQHLMKIFIMRLDPLREHYPTLHGLKASSGRLCQGEPPSKTAPIEGRPTEFYGTSRRLEILIHPFHRVCSESMRVKSFFYPLYTFFSVPLLFELPKTAFLFPFEPYF
jgi:hypothetical protein